MPGKKTIILIILLIAVFAGAWVFGPDDMSNCRVFSVECPSGSNANIFYIDDNLFISNRPTSMLIDTKTGSLAAPLDPALILKLKDQDVVTGRFNVGQPKKIGIRKKSKIDWTASFDRVTISNSDNGERLFYFTGKRFYIKDKNMKRLIHKSEFGFSPNAISIVSDYKGQFIGAASGWKRFEFILTKALAKNWARNFPEIMDYFKPIKTKRTRKYVEKNSAPDDEIYSRVIAVKDASSLCIDPSKKFIAYYVEHEKSCRVFVRNLSDWSIAWQFDTKACNLSKLALYKECRIISWPGRHSSDFLERIYGAGKYIIFEKNEDNSAKIIKQGKLMPGQWAGFSLDGERLLYLNSLKGTFEAFLYENM